MRVSECFMNALTAPAYGQQELALFVHVMQDSLPEGKAHFRYVVSRTLPISERTPPLSHINRDVLMLTE